MSGDKINFIQMTDEQFIVWMQNEKSVCVCGRLHVNFKGSSTQSCLNFVFDQLNKFIPHAQGATCYSLQDKPFLPLYYETFVVLLLKKWLLYGDNEAGLQSLSYLK